MQRHLFKKIKNFIQKLYFDRNFQPILKLVHIEFSKKRKCDVCLVQIIGKNAFAEFDVEYLIGYRKILSAFSHEDVIEITRSHERTINDTQKNKYIIREIHTHELSQRNVVVIGEAGNSENLQTISLDELQSDKVLLNQFRPEEAFRLGQIKAIQEIEAERDMMNKIKMQES